jgi:hypothetical protein
MLQQAYPQSTGGSLHFSRSEYMRSDYFAELQAPNGNWSRRISFRPQYRFELLKLGIPDERIDFIQKELEELPLGASLTIQL